MTSLSRLALRDLSRHKLQSLLAILGIALGVGVMLAIDLASETALRAFEWSTTTITGQATHRILGPPGTLTVEDWVRLRNDNPGLSMTPVLSKDLVVNVDGSPKRFQLLGVDPTSEKDFRTWSAPNLDSKGAAETLRLFTEASTAVLVSPTYFEKRLEWNGPQGVQSLRPVGTLKSDSPMDRPYLEQLIVADLATATKLLTSEQITSIDLKLSDAQKDDFERKLPQGIWLEEANQQRYAARQLLQSFRANLKALSFLSLIVGLLLIFSTMSFAVSRRVQRFGILRTLGVTRLELRDLVLFESWVIGFVGSLLGLGLGKLLSSVMTHFVLQTINDLYFSVHVSQIPEPPQKYIEGLAIGLFCTLLATWWPARRAMSSTPRMNFQTGPASEPQMRNSGRLQLSFGTLFLFLVVIGVYCSRNQILDPLFVAFATLLAFLLGATLLCIPLAKALIDAAAFVTRKSGIFDLHLALRTLQRILPRLSLAIVSLVAAFSVTVGMDIMIGSFRMNVLDWLMSALKADVYVAPKSFSATRFEDEIRSAVLAKIQGSPEVQAVSITKHQWVQVDRQNQTPSTSRIRLVSIRPAEQTKSTYKTLHLSSDQVWDQLTHTRSVIASEVLASRIGLRLNEEVRIHTRSGVQQFKVIDFFTDYGSTQGIFIGGWNREFLSSQDPNADTATTASIFFTPEGLKKREAVVANWAKGLDDLRFQTNSDLREGSIAIFDRTFTVTRIMRLLALLIACAALTSALSSAHLDRIQSIAVQRTLGFSSLQLVFSFLAQSATLGLVAGLLAIPTGIGISWILIHVVNDVSFGWRIDWRLDTASYGGLFLWVLAASWLATLLPIWRCLRTQPSAIMKGDT
jgi:putative ABC transport system permease protein